jgi:Flp pilus assembly protein TadG
MSNVALPAACGRRGTRSAVKRPTRQMGRPLYGGGRPATQPASPGTTAARFDAPIRHARSDRGSVTAELAAAVPALMLLLVAGLGAVSGVATKLNCLAAARDAALAAARGSAAEAAGRRSAPPGAQIDVSAAGDLVRVTVRADVHPLGRRLPGFTVRATSIAEIEPGAP